MTYSMMSTAQQVFGKSPTLYDNPSRANQGPQRPRGLQRKVSGTQVQTSRIISANGVDITGVSQRQLCGVGQVGPLRQAHHDFNITATDIRPRQKRITAWEASNTSMSGRSFTAAWMVSISSCSSCHHSSPCYQQVSALLRRFFLKKTFPPPADIRGNVPAASRKWCWQAGVNGQNRCGQLNSRYSTKAGQQLSAGPRNQFRHIQIRSENIRQAPRRVKTEQ